MCKILHLPYSSAKGQMNCKIICLYDAHTRTLKLLKYDESNVFISMAIILEDNRLKNDHTTQPTHFNAISTATAYLVTC